MFRFASFLTPRSILYPAPVALLFVTSPASSHYCFVSCDPGSWPLRAIGAVSPIFDIGTLTHTCIYMSALASIASFLSIFFNTLSLPFYVHSTVDPYFCLPVYHTSPIEMIPLLPIVLGKPMNQGWYYHLLHESIYHSRHFYRLPVIETIICL